ncbi:MAG: hypothetical protein GC206_13325 [Alphaproteobacteria bacterium]|nr:hypothetical protein [Alphaproteobacteria bacterium]
MAKFGTKGKSGADARNGVRHWWGKFEWQRYAADPKLFVCSYAAQGVWMRALCQCAQSPHPGFLIITGDKRPTNAQLAKLFGGGVEETQAALDELVRNGVAYVTDLTHPLGPGVLYNKKMVADARAAQADAAPLPGGRTLVEEALDQASAVEDKRAKARARTEKWRAKKRAVAAAEQGDARTRNGDVTVTPRTRNGDVTVTQKTASQRHQKRHTNPMISKPVTPSRAGARASQSQKIDLELTGKASPPGPPRRAAQPPDGGGAPVEPLLPSKRAGPAPTPLAKKASNVIPIDPDRAAAFDAQIESLRKLADAERKPEPIRTRRKA